MTFVEERVREIESLYAPHFRDLLILHLTEETLRLACVLRDGSLLRISERWRDGKLLRYSYYWLDAAKHVRIGWDNAPHHQQVEGFPHHKHIGDGGEPIPSDERRLEDVMAALGLSPGSDLSPNSDEE